MSWLRKTDVDKMAEPTDTHIWFIFRNIGVEMFENDLMSFSDSLRVL